MVDANLLVREFLLGQSAVTALLGTNANGSIYCGYDLPEHFNPQLGPGIQIFRAGGESHTEITVLVDARIQVRVWADVEKPLLASQVYSAINDVLHGLCGATLTDGTIMRALEVTAPQEMTDPDTGWVAVYAFYSVMARPNGTSAPAAPQFFQGAGAPVALHNERDLYYDQDSGNLYEQVSSAWALVGNIPPGGGSSDMPSLKYHKVAGASTNAASVKGSPGTVTGLVLSNDTEYPVYVKLYDKATAPTVGTDVPAQTFQVQAGVPLPFSFGSGITYSVGIAIAITKGMADDDATPVAAEDCVVDLFYQ